MLIVVNQDNSICKVCATPESIMEFEGRRVPPPGTRKIYVEKTMEEINPDDEDIVNLLWDDDKQMMVDEDDMGEEYHERCLNDEFYEVLARAPNTKKREKIIRHERDERLYFLDRMVANPLRWEEMDAASRDDIRGYRRRLLDVTRQEGFPTSVRFPEMPAIVRCENAKP